MRVNLKTAIQALEAAILDERKAKRRERNARYYRAKRKASKSVLIPAVEPSNGVLQQRRDDIWRGITWRECPGRDEPAKKMNFALFRRGDWKGYKACQYLEGEELRAAFARIIAGQKERGKLASKSKKITP